MYHDITELQNNLSEIYEVVCENKGRQDTVASYYDKKILDDILKVHSYVYVNNPREKIELRWKGPYKVLKCKHPSNIIEVLERSKLVNKCLVK